MTHQNSYFNMFKHLSPCVALREELRDQIMHYNLYPNKMLAGLFAGLGATLVQDLAPLFITVIIFEIIDFVTGVIKSGVVSKRKGESFAFESIKAWRTIYKFVFIMVGICLAWLLEKSLDVDRPLKFANYFTAFCCGVEFWSFLENAAVISEHPVFRWLRKFMKQKLEDEIGETPELK